MILNCWRQDASDDEMVLSYNKIIRDRDLNLLDIMKRMIDEKFSQGDIIKQLKPALDDAARKNMMLTGANNARLAESFKELGSGDLTSLAETINPDGQSSPEGLSNILSGRVPTKVLSTQAIKYPLDLRSEDQDVLKIVIKERKPRRLQGGVQEDRDQSGVTAATIFLPITGTVQDTLSVTIVSHP